LKVTDMTARKNTRSPRTTLSNQIHASDAHIASTAEVVRAKPLRLLRLVQVMDMTGLGKTKIYALQAERKFPMRVQITGYSVGWIEHEVQAWIAERVAARTSSPARANGQVIKPLLP
jgi:prophage regulatory protein